MYLKHLEFGLRFPLNTEVKNILKAMNVALCQLHPSGIRKIISFVWTCKYLGFDPSVNVFRALHMLYYSTKEDCWSVKTSAGYTTCYPKLDSVKNWKKRFLFVSVPSDWELPIHFRKSVRKRLEPVDEVKRGACSRTLSVMLSQSEKETVEYFKKSTESESLMNWLPPVQVIVQYKYLCQVGMVPALSVGML